MIPATVAIFDDLIVNRPGLTNLHRYSLARLRPVPEATGIPRYEICQIENTLGGPIVCMEGLETFFLGKYSLAVYPGTIRWDSKIWMTGQSIRINGRVVPVVDFEYRRPFKDWLYAMKVDGDTVDDCRRRQTVQINRRIAILLAPPELIPATTRVPEPVPARGKIPKADSDPGKIPMFVARLIKENAIASKDICPISQNAFSKEAPAALLECFHLFEPESIKQWISMKKDCPVCKASAKTIMII